MTMLNCFHWLLAQLVWPVYSRANLYARVIHATQSATENDDPAYRNTLERITSFNYTLAFRGKSAGNFLPINFILLQLRTDEREAVAVLPEEQLTERRQTQGLGSKSVKRL